MTSDRLPRLDQQGSRSPARAEVPFDITSDKVSYVCRSCAARSPDLRSQYMFAITQSLTKQLAAWVSHPTSGGDIREVRGVYVADQ